MWAEMGILIEVSGWNRSQWRNDMIKEWEILVA
jgi:hypothetical protein